MKIMKHILIIIMFSITSLNIYAQLAEDDVRADSSKSVVYLKNTPEWKNYKTLRAVGWSSFGVGLGATVSGAFLSIIVGELNGHDKGVPFEIMTGVGAGLTFASVPLLIAAYKCKAKAKAKNVDMSFGLSQLSAPNGVGDLYLTPALNLKFNF